MKWKEEQLNDLRNNYLYHFNHKKEAEAVFNRNWRCIYARAYCLKAIPKELSLMKINRKCSMFLGCHVAERVLSHVFKNVERMPHNNKGYDFTCNKGFKIDVKSSCLHKNNMYSFYSFVFNYNKIADYFLCIGFDNRENLNPQHIWLINSNDVYIKNKLKRIFNDMSGIIIKNNSHDISKFSKYELTDKLKETIECCTELRSEYKPKVKLIRLRRKST